MQGLKGTFILARKRREHNTQGREEPADACGRQQKRLGGLGKLSYLLHPPCKGASLLHKGVNWMIFLL